MSVWKLCISILIISVGCSPTTSQIHAAPDTHRVSEVRYVMGTLLDITLYAPSEEEGRAILNDTFQIAEHLDSVLSTWKRESPVSVFNRDTSTSPRPVDPHLYRLVATSLALTHRTDGAYNIAVRPLVEVWERAARRGLAPTRGDRRHAMRVLAHDAIRLSPPSSLAKRFPGVMIETGGIGKGYAVDQMVQLLRARGVSRAFINFGRSSMAALGAPPGASGWITELALSARSSEGILTLRDETLSVSRAHGTPFIINGVAYAHIFDPKTGMPVTTSRGAALRGPSATDGEAFVKYLVIRGAPSPKVSGAWGDVAWMVRDGATVRSSNNFAEPRSTMHHNFPVQ